MTGRELGQLYFLIKETELLQKDLLTLEYRAGISAPLLIGMPKGGIKKGVAEYAAEIADLRDEITFNLLRIQKERVKIERFIGGLDDAEMRLILRLRHVNCMTWADIGYELNMERTTVSKKYRAYLKNISHNSRSK